MFKNVVPGMFKAILSFHSPFTYNDRVYLRHKVREVFGKA